MFPGPATLPLCFCLESQTQRPFVTMEGEETQRPRINISTHLPSDRLPLEEKHPHFQMNVNASGVCTQKHSSRKQNYSGTSRLLNLVLNSVAF